MASKYELKIRMEGMMIKKIFILKFLLVFFISNYSFGYQILGHGTRDCYFFVNQIKEETGIQETMWQTYIIGYFTGRNAGTGNNVGGKISVDKIYDLIKSGCAEKPSMKVYEVLSIYYSGLKAAKM